MATCHTFRCNCWKCTVFAIFHNSKTDLEMFLLTLSLLWLLDTFISIPVPWISSKMDFEGAVISWCTHDAKAFWSWWGKMDCTLCQWWQLPWCYRAQAAHWKSQPVDLAATWTPGSPGRETGPGSIIRVRIPGTAKLNLNDLRLKSWSWNHHNDVEVHASGWFVTQPQSSSRWAASGRLGHVI
jgi:hypothetical protein